VGLSRREGGNGLSQAWQNEELTEDAEPEWQTRIFEGRVAGRGLRPWLQELWLYCGSICSRCKLFCAQLCTYLADGPCGERPLRNLSPCQNQRNTFSQRANHRQIGRLLGHCRAERFSNANARRRVAGHRELFPILLVPGRRPLQRVGRFRQLDVTSRE